MILNVLTFNSVNCSPIAAAAASATDGDDDNAIDKDCSDKHYHHIHHPYQHLPRG